MRKLLLFTLIFSGTFYGSAQNQISWNTTSDVALSSFGNNFPRIVKDGSGNPIVSWGDNTDMFVATWDGTSFNTPIAVNTNGTTVAGAGWQGPDIASKGDTVHAVFKATPEADTNSHVWCVSSFDGGNTFNSPVRVDYIGDNVCRFPTITVDGQGNPIVGFMRFDAGFLDPRWVVAKSNDLGGTFSTDVLASGWSDPASEVCDCCPSKIISEGNTVAMPYRDNDGNIRDTWVGVSTDGGTSFPNGMDVDQQNWSINACPSSGPDGFIIGDNLYTTYMSGATGTTLAYYNISSISGMTGSSAIALDQISPTSLGYQNYPRVDHDNGSMAFVWKQFSNGSQELAIQFTENISTGINATQEIVDTDNVNGVDVVLNDGTIWVIWEDGASGTVKYRSGTYTSYASTSELNLDNISVYPNPSNSGWTIKGVDENTELILTSATGEIIDFEHTEFEGNSLKIENNFLSHGIYFLELRNSNSTRVIELINN